MIEVNQLCGQIYLGKQGENLARVVYFDEPASWREEFGDGICELLHQRKGDIAPYPVKLEMVGGNWCWKITSADTAVAGNGKCELHYLVNNVVVKSKIWSTKVLESLSGDTIDPPEPHEAWVDEVLKAAQKVEYATACLPIIGENQNWWVWDFDTEDYVDSGISAEGVDGEEGYTPVKGVDYWTEADKAEIKSYIDTEIGNIDGVLEEIINLQELYIKANAPDIKFYISGNEYTAKEYSTWEDFFSIQENVDNIGYSDYGDGLVRIYGGVFWLLYNDGTTVKPTDEIIADYDYQITNV